MNCGTAVLTKIDLREVLDDEAMIELDAKMKVRIRAAGLRGLSAVEIGREFGDRGLLRSGVLVAKGVLCSIGGGGSKPYILSIAD